MAGSAVASRSAALTWVADTVSPQPIASRQSWAEPCVVHERGLEEVARWVAARRAESGHAPDIDDVNVRLRSGGTPHVWPRVWTLEGEKLGEAVVNQRLAHWLARSEPEGERRCGLARVKTPAGREVLVAVVVDALADLEPLPIRARVGRWLTLDAHLLVPAEAARVVILGPEDGVRSVPTTFVDGRVRSVFSLDRAGAWRIQVLATTATGPRPALEAWVFVDTEPYASAPSERMPGEALAPRAVNDTDVLLELINAARGASGQNALVRDPALDRVANEHARTMRDQEVAAHDLGDGSPEDRVARAGVSTRGVGENVAHARDLGRAHRALWVSPSHRETLLSERFDAVGLGFASSPDGSVWLCELFADYGEAGNTSE
jgi:cysteine-rich secretory family protein